MPPRESDNEQPKIPKDSGRAPEDKVNDDLADIRGTTADKAKTVSERVLSAEQQQTLLVTLKSRFESNMDIHPKMDWNKVLARLQASPEKMWSLNEMERTGGEPDVVDYDKKTGKYIFNDCSAESPICRRNVCYDRQGQEEAEKLGYAPAGNAIEMAGDMGVMVLTKKKYKRLLRKRHIDSNSRSLLITPDKIRAKDLVLFGTLPVLVPFASWVCTGEAHANGSSNLMGFRTELRV